MEMQEIKLEFIRNTTNKDYEFIDTYDTMYDCIKVIRKEKSLHKLDKVLPIKPDNRNNDLVSVIMCEESVIVDYKIINWIGKYELYKLTPAAYERFRQDILKQLTQSISLLNSLK